MRLGIDLDNTIIGYDESFHQLALERGLITAAVPPRKQSIRDHLRAAGQERAWTELQGIAYGPRMPTAVPFPGVHDFLRQCDEQQVEWCIISHRTPTPYLGEPYDLHAAARDWLVGQGMVERSDLNRVYLESTREAKLQRIAAARCEVFIDDLPELLLDPDFPAGVRKVLFDPGDQHATLSKSLLRVASWSDAARQLLPARSQTRAADQKD